MCPDKTVTHVPGLDRPFAGGISAARPFSTPGPTATMTKTSMDTVQQELLDQRAWIEGLCNSLVRDRSQAMDLAQETVSSVLQQKGPIANLRAYVHKVAENHALQQLRKDLRRRRRERAAAEATSERVAPSAHEVGETF